MINQKTTVAIRIGFKEIRELKKLFPAKRQESFVKYFERLIEELKRRELENGKSESKDSA